MTLVLIISFHLHNFIGCLLVVDKGMLKFRLTLFVLWKSDIFSIYKLRNLSVSYNLVVLRIIYRITVVF
jgi:hypothetical protein